MTTRPTLIAALAIGLSVGCGSSSPQQASVHGKVTYRGQPIESGKIVFFSMGTAKASPAGADIVNGAYAINENGPVFGTHRVEIQAYRKTGRKIPDLMGDVSVPNRPLVDETVPLLPATFNVESTLTAEIVAPDITLDFNL